MPLIWNKFPRVAGFKLWLRLLLGLMVAPALNVGCKPAASATSPAPGGAPPVAETPPDVEHRIESLTRTYFNGDKAEALHAIEDAISLLERAPLPPNFDSDRAHGLTLFYGRLYCYYQFYGQDDDATNAYKMALRWYGQEETLAGHRGRDLDSTIEGFTPQYCEEMVRKWDRPGHPSGPVYARTSSSEPTGKALSPQ